MDTDRFTKAFVAGFLVAFTPVLGPIHEFGHYIFGTDVTITGWSKSVHGTATYIGIIGGALFELTFYVLLSWICHAIYTSTGRTAASNISIFAWGYVNGLSIAVAMSDDLNKVLPQIGESAQEGIVAWLIMSFSVVALGWVLWRNILRKS